MPPPSQLHVHLLVREMGGELRKHVFATTQAQPSLRALARRLAAAESASPDQAEAIEREVLTSMPARVSVAAGAIREAAGGFAALSGAYLYTVAYRDAGGRPAAAWAAGALAQPQRQTVLDEAARLVHPSEAGAAAGLAELMKASAEIGVVRMRALEMFPDHLSEEDGTL